MKRVIVLGCGPAGLLAAHAASMAGADVQIFSDRKPSVIGGAQYLHEHIPGLTKDPEGHVLFTKTGTGRGYARKVYGHSGMETSWSQFANGTFSRPAWSMQRAYQRLWFMYSDAIRAYHIERPEDALELELIGADLYVTTLPHRLLCENPNHIFQSVPIFILPEELPGVVIPENTVVYNGHENIPWSRASNLFGHISVEYPRRPLGRSGEMITGFKPTMHNCDCNSQWMRVGRFGQWKRGVLVHHAFKEVTHAMQQL